MNETEVTEFILTPFFGQPKKKMGLAALMTIAYLVTMIGNGLIVLVIISDSQLHNPMYFFLFNLAIIDICYTTTIVPQSIFNCLVDRPVMSFAMCFFQMYSEIYLGAAECFMLAVMAYDRYVAISIPLRYMVIMSRRVCVLLAASSWTLAFFLSVVPAIASPIHFCGNELNHYACAVMALLRLLCSRGDRSRRLSILSSSSTILFPFFFILLSYLRIIVSIIKIHSSGGRWKAFSTCGSHLAVVVVFDGVCIAAFIKPQAKESSDSEKIIYAVNTAVVPMLNPLIYTLRNKEVKGALKRLHKNKW